MKLAGAVASSPAWRRTMRLEPVTVPATVGSDVMRSVFVWPSGAVSWARAAVTEGGARGSHVTIVWAVAVCP
jgi:hypothetical protein